MNNKYTVIIIWRMKLMYVLSIGNMLKPKEPRKAKLNEITIYENRLKFEYAINDP